MENEQCKGYTLLSPIGPDTRAVLVDMDGKIVKEWEIHGDPVKMLPGGSILGYRRTRTGKDPLAPPPPEPVPPPKHDAGPPPGGPRPGGPPAGGPPHNPPWFDNIEIVQISWDGEEEWSFNNWDDNGTGVMMARWHHDFEREGNPVGYYAPGQDFVDKGKTLLLAHKNKVIPEISDKELVDDVMYEVDWDGNLTGFEWHPADHFEEYGFSESARENIYENPSYHEDRGIGDWLHLNTLSVLGKNHWYDETGDDRFHPENIMSSSRGANFIFIFSRATGEVVWQVGPDFIGGKPEHKLGQFVGQHNPHFIPHGLPGAGNVLVFDNGGTSGYGGSGFPRYSRQYSRIVEFNPVTLEIVWQYGAESGDEFFFSHNISNSQRLPNGNTFINEGANGRIFEVTVDKKIVWDIVSPFAGPMGPRVYRSYRIPPEWVPGNPAGYPEWASLYE